MLFAARAGTLKDVARPGPISARPPRNLRVLDDVARDLADQDLALRVDLLGLAELLFLRLELVDFGEERERRVDVSALARLVGHDLERLGPSVKRGERLGLLGGHVRRRALVRLARFLDDAVVRDDERLAEEVELVLVAVGVLLRLGERVPLGLCPKH